MKKLLFFFLLNLAGLKICACDCNTGINYLANADVVFKGRVIAIRPPIKDCISSYEIEFKAYKWIKGRMQTDTCKVYARGVSAEPCDILFEVNDSFEVYAVYHGYTSSPAPYLYTHLCFGTHNLK